MTGIRLTEKYQVLPSMPPAQFEALKADIAERGVLVPIDVDEEGHILDGHHRYRACTELGITDFPTIVRPGLSEEERHNLRPRPGSKLSPTSKATATATLGNSHLIPWFSIAFHGVVVLLRPRWVGTAETKAQKGQKPWE